MGSNSPATLYGQLNLTYQRFDDGGTTTDGIVDNGNWNSRLGFLDGIDAASLDLYAGWRRFTYSDRTSTSYQDADSFLVGCRFAF